METDELKQRTTTTGNPLDWYYEYYVCEDCGNIFQSPDRGKTKAPIPCKNFDGHIKGNTGFCVRYWQGEPKTK